MTDYAAPSPAARAAARILSLDRATAEVVTELRDHGVRSILLKGPSAARWLYEDESERPYVDCDLLVAPTEMANAERVLEKIGFRRTGLDSLRVNLPKHAVTFRRGDGATVDLHRSFLGVGADDDALWRGLIHHTETMPVGGTQVEVLTTPARALTIALHAAKDGAREAKVREDVARTLERVQVEEWRQAVHLAEQLGCGPAFAAGLGRVPEGAVLAQRLGLPTTTTTALALRATAPTPLAVGMNWLLTTPGIRGKLPVVVRKLFPPPSYLRGWSPLARRGSWGLAVAYIWRPIWMASRSIPALLAVRRAGKSAAASTEPGTDS
jgi:Uncharacterised nucleotidyltransferase